MIGEEKLTKALGYLAETDHPYAQAKAAVDGYKYRLKIAKAQALLGAGSGTVPEKEAKAETDQGYRMMVDEYEDAVTDMHTMGTKRETAKLIIEVWRTEQANQRVGHV